MYACCCCCLTHRNPFPRWLLNLTAKRDIGCLEQKCLCVAQLDDYQYLVIADQSITEGVQVTSEGPRYSTGIKCYWSQLFSFFQVWYDFLMWSTTSLMSTDMLVTCIVYIYTIREQIHLLPRQCIFFTFSRVLILHHQPNLVINLSLNSIWHNN